MKLDFNGAVRNALTEQEAIRKLLEKIEAGDFDFKSVNLADIDELLAKKKRTCYALLKMYLDGFTTSEIADRLNIKEHNVSSAVSYAIKELKSETKD